jgi:hypothetical protein
MLGVLAFRRGKRIRATAEHFRRIWDRWLFLISDMERGGVWEGGWDCDSRDRKVGTLVGSLRLDAQATNVDGNETYCTVSCAGMVSSHVPEVCIGCLPGSRVRIGIGNKDFGKS